MDVAHVSMRITHDDFVRTSLDRPLNNCVCISGHQLPKGIVSRKASKNLFKTFKTCGSFHIDGNEQLHLRPPASLVDVTPGMSGDQCCDHQLSGAPKRVRHC